MEPFSRGAPARKGGKLFLTSATLSVLPLDNSTPLLVAVATVVVTKDGVDENTEGHRSPVTVLVSGIHALLLRGSDRQLLKRGRGGFGVLPAN